MYRCIILLVVCATQMLWSADGFDGTWVYRDDDTFISAVITVQNERIQGRVNEDGETYTFTGTVNAHRADISINMDGELIRATLALANGDLLVDLDGERYRYKRQQARPQAAVPVPAATNKPPQQQPQQQRPGVNGPVVLERKTLTDPGVNNMPSHTILVPKGWQVKGGAWWAAPAYFKVLPSQDIIVTAPSGAELHVAPHFACFDYRPSAQAISLGGKRLPEGQSENGYPVVHQPDDDATWKRKLAEGLSLSKPGATNIVVDDIMMVPQLTALLEQRLAPLKAQTQPGSFCFGAVFSSSIRYTSNGQNWEQLSIFGITNIGFDSDFGRNIYWTVEPNVVYRAPAGQLAANMPLLTTIVNSIGHTPEWTRMVNEHSRKINQVPSFKPSIITDAGKSANDILFEGWQKREGIKDQSQRRNIETIREVTTYSNGDSTVQLPTGYNTVYGNGQGDYILSNDSFYQPGTDPSINQQNWQTLQSVP